MTESGATFAAVLLSAIMKSIPGPASPVTSTSESLKKARHDWLTLVLANNL